MLPRQQLLNGIDFLVRFFHLPVFLIKLTILGMTKYLFVCISNYCRSPVAEKIFNNLNIDNTISKSAGINDFLAMNMDPRSQDYLKTNGIQDTYHQPRKVSYNLLSKSDKIFALDSFVFLFLKKNFKNQNIKIINTYDRSFALYDPFKLKNLDEYNDCLDNVKNCVEIIASRENPDAN